MQFDRLKDLREDAEKKQLEIAKLLRITQQQYSLYETGKREIPFSMCLTLADLYNVSLDYIAGRTNDKRGIGYAKQVNIKHNSTPNNDNNKYNTTSSNSGNKYNIMQSNNGGMNNISIKNK